MAINKEDVMGSFEELNVWKMSMDLSVEIYQELKDSKDWGIRDQVLRSALSISSNIAEGHERDSSKEFVRFLNIAIASCSELRSQLYFLMKTGLMEENKSMTFIEQTRKISAMLYKLIKSIKNKMLKV
jgi:four helix bundle protein